MAGGLERLAEIRVGPVRYNSPSTQIVLVGLVVFSTVGMFSALTNIGAGGGQDVSLVDTTNAVLYGLFAVFSPLGGTFCNIFGPRLTIFIGTWGYAMYVGALWCFQETKNRGFVIASGAILGICAALLWAAQGSIMMAYPLEKDKGKSFSIFWGIFQSGAVVGAAIALGLSWHSDASSVSTGVYVAFIIIIFIGMLCSWLLLPPNYIVRSDKTLVKLEAQSSIKQELKGIVETFTDWRMLCLLPYSFASNYFYAYQGAINAFYFNGRTRALNALLEGVGAIAGAFLIGSCCLDLEFLGKRKTRGYIGLSIVGILLIGIWTGALVWQLKFTRASHKPNLDFSSPEYNQRGVLYFFFYFGDAAYQAMAYWIMASLTNDPWTLARYTGFYKALQSAGAAGSFGMDAVATPFLNEHLASWIMMLVSLPLAAYVISTIKDTNYEVEKTVHVEELDQVPGVHGGGAPVIHHDEEKKEASVEERDEKLPV